MIKKDKHEASLDEGSLESVKTMIVVSVIRQV